MKYLQRHNYSVGPSTEVIGLQIVQKGENKEMARPGLNWPKKSQCHGPASCACWLCAASFPLKTTCDVPGWQIRSSSAQRCAAKIAPIRESGNQLLPLGKELRADCSCLSWIVAPREKEMTRDTASCLSRCVLFVAAPDLRGKLCCGVVAFRCAHGGKGFQDDDLRCLFAAGSRP